MLDREIFRECLWNTLTGGLYGKLQKAKPWRWLRLIWLKKIGRPVRHTWKHFRERKYPGDIWVLLVLGVIIGAAGWFFGAPVVISRSIQAQVFAGVVILAVIANLIGAMRVKVLNSGQWFWREQGKVAIPALIALGGLALWLWGIPFLMENPLWALLIVPNIGVAALAFLSRGFQVFMRKKGRDPIERTVGRQNRLVVEEGPVGIASFLRYGYFVANSGAAKFLALLPLAAPIVIAIAIQMKMLAILFIVPSMFAYWIFWLTTWRDVKFVVTAQKAVFLVLPIGALPALGLSWRSYGTIVKFDTLETEDIGPGGALGKDINPGIFFGKENQRAWGAGPELRRYLQENFGNKGGKP